MTLGVAALLAAQMTAAFAQPAGPSSAQQSRRDTEAIHALGVSGVRAARVIAPDGRRTGATSGTADLRTGHPVSSDGSFCMAGTSKTLVANVVLQLEAEGSLSLDDAIDHWLPGALEGTGNDGSRITIRQLLQHTSGSEGRGNPWTDARKITYGVASRPETDGRRRVPCSSQLSSAPFSAVPAWLASPDRERSKQPVSRRNP
ncbi:serine hydrolase domain-containing protein [Streptomyces sp. NPDC054904]|uniref:serine hydrolase domain-containing protein n=1 Tax=Streptomyces sp. NPDC090054 TaxID=3365933 RepID=UPI00381DB64F